MGKNQSRQQSNDQTEDSEIDSGIKVAGLFFQIYFWKRNYFLLFVSTTNLTNIYYIQCFRPC